MDMNSGRIAAIVIGSTASLLFVYVFALVCKMKLDMRFREREDVEREDVKPEPSVKDTSILRTDETLNANTERPISRSNLAQEIDGRMNPGVELEVDRIPREMDSNEPVGHELAVRNSHISELPC